MTAPWTATATADSDGDGEGDGEGTALAREIWLSVWLGRAAEGWRVRSLPPSARREIYVP